MKYRSLALPTLALGFAALLLAPLHPVQAFTKIGGLLNPAQRDVRVFNNFDDATANDNTTPNAQFPGRTGAELAIWKAIVEWGSRLHGDGSGDPMGGNLLGSGGANFDAMWAGTASGIGGTNDNVISAISNCAGGSLAYTEVPIATGWRIRFCDQWVWDDGPGPISAGRWDIQSVACSRYGSSLGLGNSSVANTTMNGSIAPGTIIHRSIEADDIAGVQCIYGPALSTKPVISATVASAGTLTIHGVHFDATDNEVWFTPSGVTAGNVVDPLVRVTGVASSFGGAVLTVTIPAEAGPGDVIVKTTAVGGASISNAFPTDLVGTFGDPPEHPELTGVTPSTIEALIPGTVQSITLTGTQLDLTTSVVLDGVAIPPSRFTIVDPSTITLDIPQASSLGTHDLGVADGSGTDTFPVTIVAPATPTLQWGTGDALNVVDRDTGLGMIVSGPVGSLQVVRGSPNGPPTFDRYVRSPLALVDAGTYVIPAEGWVSAHLGGLPDPALVGATWFARSFEIVKPKPYPVSNDQSITLVP